MTDHFALFDDTPHPWIEPEALREKFLARSAQVHPDRLHQAPEADRRAAGERFAQLNAAYNCLRDPKERLRHLLELKLGTKPPDVQRIPPAFMDFFFDAGRLCKSVDGYLEERRRVTSPILKAQFIESTMEWVDRLNALQRTIHSRQEELFAELKALDRVWSGGPPGGLSTPLASGYGVAALAGNTMASPGGMKVLPPTGLAVAPPPEGGTPYPNASNRDVGDHPRNHAATVLPRLEEIYRLLGYFGRWSEQLRERVVQLSF